MITTGYGTQDDLRDLIMMRHEGQVIRIQCSGLYQSWMTDVIKNFLWLYDELSKNRDDLVGLWDNVE